MLDESGRGTDEGERGGGWSSRSSEARKRAPATKAARCDANPFPSQRLLRIWAVAASATSSRSSSLCDAGVVGLDGDISGRESSWAGIVIS